MNRREHIFEIGDIFMLVYELYALPFVYIAFRKMIISSLARWARESFIESTELVRSLFALLLRQYNGVSEIIDGLGNTYVIHDRNTKDVETFFVYLSHVRTLLSVQFEWVEEEIVKKCLWFIMQMPV
uniref:Ryanodine receptor junctional solenoid domain-containing protein n=1 Tax=Romanomermis culicivorax TaxID=13658 RepID=A0A915J8I0_ROMCU